MSRRVALLLAGTLVVATACGTTQPASGRPATPASTAHDLDPLHPAPTPRVPATVTDATGEAITVESAARIVPLWGSLAEIVFTLGLGDRVVGRDVAATFAEAQHLPLVTRAHDVSAEAVLSLRPTVVLAGTDTGPPEALEQIRRAGVPVVTVAEATSLDDIAPRIRLVADALGVPDAGEELVARTAIQLEDAAADAPDVAARPTVAFLYVRGQAGVSLLGGRGSGADAMVEAAGGTDAGSALGLGPFTPITSEALADAAPDVILMMTDGLRSVGGLDGALAVPGVAQTPAGRDRRIVTIDDELLYSFGPRTPAALRSLTEQLSTAR